MTKILGLAKLQNKLNRLPKTAKTTIRAAMEEQADVIVAMMKSLAPKGKTHELEDSIGWSWGKLPTGSSIVAQVKSSLGGDMTITIYAGDEVAYYAAWQEHGTQKMHARPYFFVSWRANKKAAKAAVRTATRQAAKAVAAS